MGFVPVGDGFWKLGGFEGDDIWANGTKMAPFDEEVSHEPIDVCIDTLEKIIFRLRSFILL